MNTNLQARLRVVGVKIENGKYIGLPKSKGWIYAGAYEDKTASGDKMRHMFVKGSGIYKSEPFLAVGHMGGLAVRLPSVCFMLPVMPSWYKSPEIFKEKTIEFIEMLVGEGK